LGRQEGEVITACVAVLAIAVAVANIVTGRALWRSEVLERSQKVLQTCLMWLVPGSFVLVRVALRNSTPGYIAKGPTSDPTISRDHGYYTDNPTGFTHGDGGHGL
jgi:hypothetical protein